MNQKRITLLILSLSAFGIFTPLESIGSRGGGSYHPQQSHPQEMSHTQAQAHYQTQSHAQEQVHYQAQHSQAYEHHDYNYPSPSMSRADVHPNNNVQAHYPQSFNAAAHPSQSQVQQYMNPKNVQTTPQLNQAAFSNHAALQGQFQKYIQPSTSPLTNQAALNQQQNLKNSLPRLNQTNAQTAANATNQFHQQHPNASSWFNNDFFAQHHYNPNYYNHNGNWWGSGGWNATASWIGLGALGTGYAANYYDDNGLFSSFPPQEANSYSPPPQNIYINTAPPLTNAQSAQNDSNTPIQGDFLPLGVFAIGSTAEQAPYSNMILQLALSKEGDISGTYYNAATDQTYQIEGIVDKDSQKAAWKLSNNPESPVATTGLYNLTQDVTNIQVHFPNGTDQTKVLVRLKNN